MPPADSIRALSQCLHAFGPAAFVQKGCHQEECWSTLKEFQCLSGKSNSGEGGEDPQRWEELGDVDAEGNSPTFPHLKGLKEGDVASSRIKQVSWGFCGSDPLLCQST
jgi:hypothetical protein